jgi:hypothetical protein
MTAKIIIRPEKRDQNHWMARKSPWPTPGLAHQNASLGMPEESDLAKIRVEFCVAGSVPLSFLGRR